MASTNAPKQLFKQIAERPLVIVDGALATELENRGEDLRDGLWSAKVLVERPSVIEAVHRDYYLAGADVSITASYQATVEGFAKKGIDRERALELIAKSVALASQARDDAWGEEVGKGRMKPLVAGSVGPYGAFLANGAEYTGQYDDIDEKGLIDFHRPRIAALVQAGVDILACETIPRLAEALALAKLLSQEFPNTPAWFSFSCRDGEKTCYGEKISECAVALNPYEQVISIGINCTAPEHVSSLVANVRKSTTKHIVVYPNSGEVYDAVTKTWGGVGHPERYLEMAKEWHQAGANMIGGCCRTTPAHIKELRVWADSL